MNRGDRQVEETLDGYRKLVLRWNSQINLISRQDTPELLDNLIHQCWNSWNRLAGADTSGMAEASPLWYFDLGSGGGFPGVIWHLKMVAAKLPVRTFLVEPREKRSWFLERVAQQVDPEFLHVQAHRWDEAPPDGLEMLSLAARPSHVLISLKALRLTDVTVLAGLSRFLEACRPEESAAVQGPTVLIARFHPPDQKWSSGLADELEIPEKGRLRGTPACLFRSEGGRILEPATLPGASLVLSEYRAQTP